MSNMKEEILMELLEKAVERMLMVENMRESDSFKYGWVLAEAKYIDKTMKRYKEGKNNDGTV